MITKNKWILLLIITPILLILVACGNSSIDSEKQMRSSNVKPTATKQSVMKPQVKPTATKQSVMKESNNKTKILEKRTPSIFSTPDSYNNFPKNIQDNCIAE